MQFYRNYFKCTIAITLLRFRISAQNKVTFNLLYIEKNIELINLPNWPLNNCMWEIFARFCYALLNMGQFVVRVGSTGAESFIVWIIFRHYVPPPTAAPHSTFGSAMNCNYSNFILRRTRARENTYTMDEGHRI